MGLLWWLASEFGGYLAVGLGLVAAYFGLQWRGEHKGRTDERREQEIRGAGTLRKVEDDLARTPADERRKRMLEWKR